MAKERPIILKAHEVRGILDGRQTQLRRIAKPLEGYDYVTANKPHQNFHALGRGKKYLYLDCPFGQVGDRLWVKEAFCRLPVTVGPVAYKADHPTATHFQNVIEKWRGEEGRKLQWKSSTHMPRWASRILLKIVSVRVERVLDITDEDALESGIIQIPDSDWFGWEGCKQAAWSRTAASAFHSLCETFDGNGTCYSNAWQWVIEFKRVEA